MLFRADGAGRKSSAFVVVVAKLETVEALGAGVECEVGVYYLAFPEEEESFKGIVGVVTAYNGKNH